MATGFVQRYRGKIAARELWYQQRPGIVASTATALSYDSLQILPVSSLAAVYDMPAPQVGAVVTLAASSGAAAGTGTRVVWAATGSFFGTTNTTLTFSTLGMQAVTLIGVSTTLWCIENSTVVGPTGA